MKTQALTSFVVVVEHQSLTRAASALGYSPSAVSYQLRELQKWVGVPLFERRTCLELTPAGRAFHEAAVHALRLLDRGAEAARSAEHPRRPLRRTA